MNLRNVANRPQILFALHALTPPKSTRMSTLSRRQIFSAGRSIPRTVRERTSRPPLRQLMPPQIGAGEFWFGITDLANGVRTIPQVLATIDAAWPT